MLEYQVYILVVPPRQWLKYNVVYGGPRFFFFFLLPTDIAVQQYSISENSECLHNLFRMEIAYENIVLCDAHTHWYTLHIIHETIYPLLGLFTDSKCMFFFLLLLVLHIYPWMNNNKKDILNTQNTWLLPNSSSTRVPEYIVQK